MEDLLRGFISCNTLGKDGGVCTVDVEVSRVAWLGLLAEGAMGEFGVGLVDRRVCAVGDEVFLPEFGIDGIAVEGTCVGRGSLGKEHVPGGVGVVVCWEVPELWFVSS